MAENACYCAVHLARMLREDATAKRTVGLSLIRAINEAKRMLREDPSLHSCRPTAKEN